MDRNRGGRPRHPDVLTPAEWRVLEALRDGGTNAEIGARLGLRLDTVKYHISNMLAKLELRDRRALDSMALRRATRSPASTHSTIPAAAITAVARHHRLGGGHHRGRGPCARRGGGARSPRGSRGTGRVSGQRRRRPPRRRRTQPEPRSPRRPYPASARHPPTRRASWRCIWVRRTTTHSCPRSSPAYRITPVSDGRYVVDCGQQVTVVTAAPQPCRLDHASTCSGHRSGRPLRCRTSS